jgi:flavin reductase (DIM6/NTAB) family NADH-FMN oxidoreductase RutF/pimeloyl-ACP methyl ester carboxylesterase
MRSTHFKGFAGVRLTADVRGEDDAPPVLLLHGAGQTRHQWADVGSALELAGRKVISLDLRGHGTSEWPGDARYDFDAYVEDVKAVLAQMPERPVIIATSLGAWTATTVLGEEGAHVAAGLVLVDSSGGPAIAGAATLAEAMQRCGMARVSPDFDPLLGDAMRFAGVEARLRAAAERLALPVLLIRGEDSVDDGLPAVIRDGETVAVEPGALPGGDQGSELLNGLLLDFLERRIPLAPPEYREGSDARTFRDALGCFATGITIVTAFAEDGQPIGLTANSFTSVSLDPPLLLVCIANSAGSAAVLEKAERFAVNVLQIGQQPTSNRFAGRGEDRFAATPWVVGEFSTPVLTGSLASFECTRHAVHDGGDHFILIGRVQKAMFEPRRDPLLYFRGKYRRLHFA